MLPWFTENFMEANPSKYKFMVFSKTSHLYDIKIGESVTLESAKCTKILYHRSGSRQSPELGDILMLCPECLKLLMCQQS